MDAAQQLNGNAEPKPVAQIIITQMSDGNVLVAGPLQNKLLMYGLLEVARQTVQDVKPPPESQILPARFKLG